MKVPGGNPVIAVPGLTPRSPSMTVLPVFVTVDPPRTPNVAAVPKRTVWALTTKGAARPHTIKDRILMMTVMILK